MNLEDYLVLDFDSLIERLSTQSSRVAHGAASIKLLKTLGADMLIALLGHRDGVVRGHAALALGQMKEPRAVDALIGLLGDDETRGGAGRSAAWALGEIGDVRAVEPLIASLSQPSASKGTAVQALARLRDDRAVEPLIHMFEGRPDPSLATVLGNWGDRRAVEPLVAVMEHPDSHVRFYAARALGKLGDARALPALERALDNDIEPITDTQSLRGKSVSYVAAKAIEKIKSSPEVD